MFQVSSVSGHFSPSLPLSSVLLTDQGTGAHAASSWSMECGQGTAGCSSRPCMTVAFCCSLGGQRVQWRCWWCWQGRGAQLRPWTRALERAESAHPAAGALRSCSGGQRATWGLAYLTQGGDPCQGREASVRPGSGLPSVHVDSSEWSHFTGSLPGLSPPLPSTQVAPPVPIEQTFTAKGFCCPVKAACLRDVRRVAEGAPVPTPTPHLGPVALRRPFSVVLLLFRKTAHLLQQGPVLKLEPGRVAIAELATAGLVCRIVPPKHGTTCPWGSLNRSFLNEFPKEERSVWTPALVLSGCPQGVGLCGRRAALLERPQATCPGRTLGPPHTETTWASEPHSPEAGGLLCL